MEKVRVFINRWGLTIMLPIVLFSWVGGCNSSKKVDKLQEEITVIKDSSATKQDLKIELNKELKKYATKKDVKDEMERTMLDFLIYEDELDKKRITISQIKDKIEAND